MENKNIKTLGSVLFVFGIAGFAISFIPNVFQGVLGILNFIYIWYIWVPSLALILLGRYLKQI